MRAIIWFIEKNADLFIQLAHALVEQVTNNRRRR